MTRPMALPVTRRFPRLIATAILLTTVSTAIPTTMPRASGQGPGDAPSLPTLPPVPFAPAPTPASVPLISPAPPKAPPIKIKEFSNAEVDVLVAKILGPGSPESKRPIRIALEDPSFAIAAQSAVIVDGTVEFTKATVGFGKIGEIFHCDTCVLRLQQNRVMTKLDELSAGPIEFIDLHSADQTIRVDASQQGQMTRVVTKMVPLQSPSGTSFQPVTEQIVMNAPIGFAFHYKFRIDPKTPVASLLPAAPRSKTAAIPFNDDVRLAPELSIGDPVSKSLTKQHATQAIAKVMAGINHLNAKQTDGFMVALSDRGDLRGLPFRMGQDCRTRDEEQAREFGFASEQIQTLLRAAKNGGAEMNFWQTLRSRTSVSDAGQRAEVAALTQILMPESESLRVGLAKHLATIPHPEASRALARMVLFSPENAVRVAATDALKTRRERDYTDILLGGFQYPVPAVARRAAEALVKLDRQDLLGELVDVLEQPDPRLPTTQVQGGKEVTAVRELVKINHHRNCLLCHAPGNTEGTPQAALKVMVPLPGEPFPTPEDGSPYVKSSPTLPDIVVRLDMTYLRQDFSLMMPVADAHPWPEMQRFDFLIRTRAITPEEVDAYRAKVDDDPSRPSPYRRAALFALRELTGRDAEPTAGAWRELVKRTKRS